MRTIWKFTLLVEDHPVIEMPSGAEVIAVEPTGTPAVLELWAIVDPRAKKERRRFEIRGTGHELGEVGRHVGTVRSSALVWHVFEAAAPPVYEAGDL